MSETKGLSVMITGGSGLIGRHLTAALLAEGFTVSHLSRKPYNSKSVKVHTWDPVRGYLEPDALEGIDYIIHLAGANIGARPWTSSRKDEIMRSRIESAKLLHQTITYTGVPLKAFISASAVGFYGAETTDTIFTEDDSPGTDFLGITCRRWEEAAELFENSKIRTVKIRTAVVLEKSDSALSKLMLPGKLGFLVKTGSGLQYMPWIHISDLCGIYLMAIADARMSGSYNAVAPQQVTHTQFIKVLGEVMKRPVVPQPVPAVFLKAVMGQMSDVILKGSRISPDKIIKAGYHFNFPGLYDALLDVIRNR